MTTQQWDQDHPPMPEEIRNELLEHRNRLAIFANMLDPNLEKEEPIINPVEHSDLIRQLVSERAISGNRTTVWVFNQTADMVNRLDEMQMECSRAKAFPAQGTIEKLRQQLDDAAFPLHDDADESQVESIALELRKMAVEIVDLIEEDLQQAFGEGHRMSL